FFFSSRRRHTRFSRDWSSDVCLPILDGAERDGAQHRGGREAGFSVEPAEKEAAEDQFFAERREIGAGEEDEGEPRRRGLVEPVRSEERRVGKELRSRWGRCQGKTENW